ncbi:transposase family protein [Sinosporangium siamense]|uniref:transposase family protein n=1 Tax=Sinosporangium siamense TaxID=1367973 RepID=UPI001952122A
MSRSTLNYVAGLIRRRRKAVRSAWRLLNPGQQALLVLVHLRKGETFAELGAGFGVSAATAWRYVEETVVLLSARSPKLGRALDAAKRAGPRHLVLDGTLVRTDRVRADRPYFSSNHRTHGVNVQVVASPEGTPLWTSGALPGGVHDLTAARITATFSAAAASAASICASIASASFRRSLGDGVQRQAAQQVDGVGVPEFVKGGAGRHLVLAGQPDDLAPVGLVPARAVEDAAAGPGEDQRLGRQELDALLQHAQVGAPAGSAAWPLPARVPRVPIPMPLQPLG